MGTEALYGPAHPILGRPRGMARRTDGPGCRWEGGLQPTQSTFLQALRCEHIHSWPVSPPKMHGKGRQVQEVTTSARWGRSSTTAGGMAGPGMAVDDGKQLLAKQAIPELTAEATRHLRVPKRPTGADPPTARGLLGWEKGALGAPDPLTHNWTGLNVLVVSWQGGHPPASKHSAAGDLGSKPRHFSSS